MSKPMNKTVRRVLIAFAAVVLLGMCFTFVGLYAKNEMTKPRFELPDSAQPSATELPEGKQAIFDYVAGLYNAAAAADDVEAAWHTDAKLKDYDTPIETPFSDADNEILRYIWENAGDAIKGLYPQAEHLTKSKDQGIYALNITAGDVLEATAERGRYNDDGVYVDDDYYFVTLKVSPDTIDAAAIPEGEIAGKFKEAFASAFTVDRAEVEVKSITMNFRIFRYRDHLDSLEITRAYGVKADLTLTDAFADLAPEKTVSVAFPYESTEKISFRYYDAYFTQSCIVQNKGDMNALPASITVRNDATAEDYDLTFDVSKDGIVEIDSDGVMTVHELSEDPITVTMTLVFHGHTYTDSLLVYLTELEVATDAQ